MILWRKLKLWWLKKGWLLSEPFIARWEDRFHKLAKWLDKIGDRRMDCYFEYMDLVSSPCATCDATGRQNIGVPVDCEVCGGQGIVYHWGFKDGNS